MGNVAEQHKITCPYCTVGWGVITLSRNGDSITYSGDGHPRCNTCKRFFILKRRLRLYGAQIEQDQAPLGANGGF